MQKSQNTSLSRRAFLSTSLFLACGAVAHSQLQGGLAEVLPKQTPDRSCRIVPPGAGGVKRFYDKCTGCQLCVAACPGKVLRPSSEAGRFLQPEVGFESGWCRPECTACGEVCPTGAILPLTSEQKTAVHVGTARVDLNLCLTVKDDVSCGNCARHCPTGAIRMVEVEGRERPVPVVSESLCIGCGACEFLCPSRPVSAIVVDGLETHRID